MDETKLTAALPNLDVQIVHRALPEQNAEAISITFTATPNFEAASRMLAPNLPLLALWMAPMQAWTGLVQQAWAPWLNVMGAGARLLERK
ncbi:hypothetical protein [Azospirillum sp. TSO22-1]|uniref:hypothetical protein n=1 Tax=Azospirillum sp. TSO22-1 TaxID=716789 RepID=UPI000D61F9EE|nr:hypothetical protein [Azospirillum sp. TSO22-1]PWC43133.1 hypothetical protein TSO221_20680 [Azospirillum sp. TSO22-1]